MVMGIMILPLVSSLAEDALRAVPRGLREAAYALGATRMQTTAAGGRAGRVLGHRRGVHPRRLARHRRDDDRRHRRRATAAAHAQPARAHRDDDRLHRAGEPRRHARRARSSTGRSSRSGMLLFVMTFALNLVQPAGCAIASARSTRDGSATSAPAIRILQAPAQRAAAARRWPPLAALLFDVARDGAGPPELAVPHQLSVAQARAQAGILPALVGTLWLIALTALLARAARRRGRASTSRSTARRGRVARFIEINIANLAGVPSIIYGLLGLGLFVRTLGMGRSVLAGASTLRAAGPAHRHPVDPRGARGGARVAARRLVRPGRDQLADHLAPGAAGGAAGDPHRHHPRRSRGPSARRRR